MTSTVGVVGLGVMGSAMSHSLLEAGYEVVGYDIDPAKLQNHLNSGGQSAVSALDAANRVDTLITSLPTVAAFEAVITGMRDLSKGRAQNLVIIEASTLPLSAKFWATAALAGSEAVILDCPLSGTGAQARTKDLIVYVSGDEDAASRAALVFEGFARRHVYVGEYGMGSKFKYVANLLVAIHNVAAAEAVLLARRAGIDLNLMLSVIGDGAGASRMFQVRGPMMVQGRYGEATARVEMFLKDIDIIREFAADLKSPVPLFLLSSQFYEAAQAQGRGDEDTSSVLAVLEQMAPS